MNGYMRNHRTNHHIDMGCALVASNDDKEINMDMSLFAIAVLIVTIGTLLYNAYKDNEL